MVNIPRVTIKDRIKYILNDIKRLGNTSFRNILPKRTSKVEVVVTFLALLELVKRHIISANQVTLFGDIDLKAEGELDQEMDIEIEFSE